MIRAIPPQRFKTGQRAASSGLYWVFLSNGRPTEREIAVTGGDPFPPFEGKPAEYQLSRLINVVYSTASSAAVLDDQTATWSAALRDLAKK